MVETNSNIGEPTIIRLVRTLGDLDGVKFDEHDKVVVIAIKDGNYAVDGDSVAERLFSCGISGYQISNARSKGIRTLRINPRPYVYVRRTETSTQPQHEPQVQGRCYEPSQARKMNIDELATCCAKMPVGVGEEEYLARLDEIGGDPSGEAS